QVDPAVQAALIEASEKLKAAGWTVEEVDCPPMRRAAEVNASLWMGDTAFGAVDLIEREDDPDSRFVFAQMSRDAGEADLESVMKALQERYGLVRQWELFLQDYPLFLCPMSGELPFAQQLDVRSEEDFARVLEAQLPQRALPAIGVPALSVATGEVGNLPVGVQLVASRFREDILLAAGRDIERASAPVTVTTPNWE
ncbi:MAG: amidase, partial [Roseibium sp.]|uniref:amidase family protein n=1 Tax=Roseibium sp. TaxID=1936156 RepID=UPI002608C994